MYVEKLTEKILEVTNNSDYRWNHIDSHAGDSIRELLTEALRIHDVVGRSELLRDYFAWHEEKGYVSHKTSDIDEFLSEQ